MEQLFLLFERKDGTWGVDGGHSLDSDLTSTYQIYESCWGMKQYLKVVVKDNFIESVEPATEEAKEANRGPKQIDMAMANLVKSYRGGEG